VETAIKTKTICLSMSAAFLSGNVQVNQSAYTMFGPFGKHRVLVPAWCAAHAACVSPVSERHWLQAIARESVGARQHLGDPPGRRCPGSFEFT
jgi:hypothetical protein